MCVRAWGALASQAEGMGAPRAGRAQRLQPGPCVGQGASAQSRCGRGGVGMKARWEASGTFLRSRSAVVTGAHESASKYARSRASRSRWRVAYARSRWAISCARRASYAPTSTPDATLAWGVVGGVGGFGMPK